MRKDDANYSNLLILIQIWDIYVICKAWKNVWKHIFDCQDDEVGCKARKLIMLLWMFHLLRLWPCRLYVGQQKCLFIKLSIISLVYIFSMWIHPNFIWNKNKNVSVCAYFWYIFIWLQLNMLLALLLSHDCSLKMFHIFNSLLLGYPHPVKC